MAKKGEKAVEKAGWLLGISGLLMILIGALMFFTPGMTIETAILFMGVVFTVAGLLKLCEALFTCKHTKYANGLAASGVFSLVVGLIMLFGANFVTSGIILMFGALAMLLALVAFVTGIGQMVYGCTAKKGKLISVVTGVVLAILGLVMLVNPFGSAIALIMLVAMFMVVYGIVLIVLALNIKEFMY